MQNVTEAMLDRIASVEGTISGYETVCAAQALAAAELAETELARGQIRSPLHGVPLAVKDLYDTAGVRTAAGTRVMNRRVPDQDASVVARLKDAGAIVGVVGNIDWIVGQRNVVRVNHVDRGFDCLLGLQMEAPANNQE